MNYSDESIIVNAQQTVLQNEPMAEDKNDLDESEIRTLSNEFLYRRYIMNRGQVRDYFEKMSIPEYIALRSIDKNGEIDTEHQGKTYLKYLAEKMQLTIPETSKMFERLSDRGLVIWSHDGKGSSGTYVTITEIGRKLLEEQELALKEHYGKIIKKFGKQNLYQLLLLMKQLEDIMKSEMEVL